MSRQRTGKHVGVQHRDYLQHLSRSLVSTRADKRDLLREVAGHLEDATAARVAAGESPLAAARRAEEEFGTVAELAPSYQETLSVGLLRHTCAILLAAVAAQPLVWGWADQGGGTDQRQQGLLAALNHVVEAVGLFSMTAAAAALLATGVGRRWIAVGTRVVRASATTLLIASVAIIGIAAGMQAADSGRPLNYLFALGVVGLPFGWVGWQAVRCLRSLKPAHDGRHGATPA